MKTNENRQNNSHQDYSGFFDLSLPQSAHYPLFDRAPEISAIYYLNTNFCFPQIKLESGYVAMKTTPLPATETEVRMAFTYGYLCALHKSHTVDVGLFLRGKELLSYVLTKVSDMRHDRLLHVADLYEPVRRCLLDVQPEDGDSKIKATLCVEAFLTGYKTAFLCIGKYDRCLLMEGHVLHVEVLSSMLLYRQTEENARRAASRTLIYKYSADRIRAIVFDSQSIDDHGNLVSTDSEA